jgi:uncharacterized membrane protein YeaQ/YmgE (transglycosylase-associated protein family)
LGVLGAFVGGAIYWAIYRRPAEPFSFAANTWHSWLFSIFGAVLVLVLYIGGRKEVLAEVVTALCVGRTLVSG